MKARQFTCADCLRVLPVQTTGGTGYGNYGRRKVCYACCGARDVASMRETGRATLYDSDDNIVRNWPGTLRLQVTHRRVGRHNMAGKVYIVYFTGPDGAQWVGRRFGDMTEILHCRRLKAR